MEAKTEKINPTNNFAFAENILNSIPGKVLLLNIDLKIEVINQEWVEFITSHKKTVSDWKGIDYSTFSLKEDLFNEEITNSIVVELKKVVSDINYKTELDFSIFRDDKQFDLKVNIKGFEYEEQKWIIVSENDINSKYEVFDTIREPEKQLRLILENTSDNIALVTFDLKAKYIYVNASVKHLMGYEPNDLLGKSFFDFIHPDDKKNLLPLLKDILKAKVKSLLTGKKHEASKIIEFRFIDKNGNWHFMQSSLNTAGKYIISVTRDITDKRQLEISAQESKLKYQSLYEFAPLSYQSLDEDGNLIDANPMWLKTLGYNKKEVIGKWFGSFLHPDWKSHFKENFSVFKKQGFINNVEFKIKHKKGHYLDVAFEGLIRNSSEGEFKQTYCTFKDITNNKVTEKKLLESEEKYRLLTTNTLDTIWTTDLKFNYTYINDAIFNLAGYTPKEFLGLNASVFTTEESMETIKKAAEGLVANYKKGKITLAKLEVQSIKKDGTKIDVEIISNLLFNREGELIGFQGRSNDITDRKLAEKALRENEEKFQAFSNQSTEGITVSDMDGNYVYVNTAFCKMSGYRQDELLKMTIFDMRTENKVRSSFHDIKEKMQGIPLQISLKRKDKTEYLTEIIVKVITVGEQQLLLGTIRDITDRVRMEKDLQESEEKYRIFFENNEAIILLINPNNGEITFANNAAINFYGYEKTKLIGMNINEINILSPDEIKKRIKEAKKKTSNYFILKHKLANGIIRDVEVYQTKLTLNNQEVFSIIVHDITERLINEKIRLLLETGVEQASEVVVITNTAGIIEYVNPAFEKISGYSKEEAIGANPSVLQSGKHNKQFYEELWKVILSGKTWQGEFINKRKDGVEYYEKANISPVLNKEGKITNFIAMKENITGKKLAEIELQKSEFKFRMLADHTNDWEYWRDQNGIYIYSSPASERITGYKPEEFTSDKNLFISIIKPEYKERIQHHLDEEPKINNSIFSTEFPIITKNGDERWIEHNCAPVYDSEGNYAGRRGNNRDITNRIAIQNKLKKSENKYRNFFDKDISADYLSTPEGKLIDCNLAFEKMLGYSKDELLAMNTQKLYPKPTNQKEFLDKLNDKKNLVNSELDLVKKDGTIINCIENVVAHFNENGDIIQFQGYVVDITERKQVEDALRQSENKYRSLFERSADAILIIKKNRFIDCNNATLKLLGYTSKDKILNSQPSQLSPEFQPDGRNSHEKEDEMMELAHQKGSHRFEWLHIRENGEIFPVEVLLTSVSIGNESFLHTVWRDITNRKKAEEATILSEEKYRAIVENSHDAIYIHKDDSFLFVNDKMCEVSGYSRTEFKKIIIWDMIHPDDRNRIEEYGKKRISGEAVPDNYYSRVIAKDGDIRDCEFSVRVIRYQNDFAVLGAVRDITERKKAEQKLISRNNELQIFYDAAVDREMKVMELKKELNELLEKSGSKPKYKIPK